MNIGFLFRRLFVIFFYLPTALFSNVLRSYKRIKNDQTRNAVVTTYKSLVDHFSDGPFTEAFCVKSWIQMEIQEVLRGVEDKEMQKITYKCIYPIYTMGHSNAEISIMMFNTSGKLKGYPEFTLVWFSIFTFLLRLDFVPKCALAIE